MLRTINYIVSPGGISPYSPQFAGVQGENGATRLDFQLDSGFIAEITAARAIYDSIFYRFDCEDGAGRYLTGEAKELTGAAVSFVLEKTVTETGGNLRVCLILSGVNIDTTDSGMQLFSFPVQLYFKNFPIGLDFTTASDLNKAVVQVKKMRSETYDIAQTAVEVNQETVQLRATINNEAAAALQSITSAKSAVDTTAAQSTAAAATASEKATQATDAAATATAKASEAAGYAGSALTSSVQSAGYASDASESAAAAAENLNTLLAVTGNINSVLATVISGGQ